MGNIEFALNLCGHWTISILNDKNLLNSIKSIMLKNIKVDSNAPDIERVYIGSEFCNQFIDLISIEKLKRIIDYISSNGMATTFVFPNVLENSLEHAKELISFLTDNASDTLEIAANDYGLLNYISETFPGTTLLAGRLFNKLRIDPRIDLLSLEGFKNNTDVLMESGLNTPATIKWFKKFNVKRVEFEILETGINIDQLSELFEVSFHFPWIYITTGHICQLGSINKENDDKFKLYDKCSYGCDKYFSVIKNAVFRGSVFQVGNAIFYKPIYDFEKVNELLSAHKSRLVYTVNNIKEE